MKRFLTLASLSLITWSGLAMENNSNSLFRFPLTRPEFSYQKVESYEVAFITTSESHNERLILFISSETTIGDLKKMINDQQKISFDQQILKTLKTTSHNSDNMRSIIHTYSRPLPDTKKAQKTLKKYNTVFLMLSLTAESQSLVTKVG